MLNMNNWNTLQNVFLPAQTPAFTSIRDTYLWLAEQQEVFGSNNSIYTLSSKAPKHYSDGCHLKWTN